MDCDGVDILVAGVSRGHHSTTIRQSQRRLAAQFCQRKTRSSIERRRATNTECCSLGRWSRSMRILPACRLLVDNEMSEPSDWHRGTGGQCALACRITLIATNSLPIQPCHLPQLSALGDLAHISTFRSTDASSVYHFALYFDSSRPHHLSSCT